MVSLKTIISEALCRGAQSVFLSSSAPVTAEELEKLEAVINAADYWTDTPSIARSVAGATPLRFFHVHWTMHSAGPHDLVVSFDPKTKIQRRRKKFRHHDEDLCLPVHDREE